MKVNVMVKHSNLHKSDLLADPWSGSFLFLEKNIA